MMPLDHHLSNDDLFLWRDVSEIWISFSGTTSVRKSRRQKKERKIIEPSEWPQLILLLLLPVMIGERDYDVSHTQREAYKASNNSDECGVHRHHQMLWETICVSKEKKKHQGKGKEKQKTKGMRWADKLMSLCIRFFPGTQTLTVLLYMFYSSHWTPLLLFLTVQWQVQDMKKELLFRFWTQLDRKVGSRQKLSLAMMRFAVLFWQHLCCWNKNHTTALDVQIELQAKTKNTKTKRHRLYLIPSHHHQPKGLSILWSPHDSYGPDSVFDDSQSHDWPIDFSSCFLSLLETCFVPPIDVSCDLIHCLLPLMPLFWPLIPVDQNCYQICDPSSFG